MTIPESRMIEQESLTQVGCTRPAALSALLTALNVKHIADGVIIHARMRLSRLQAIRDFVEDHCPMEGGAA